MLVAIVVLAMSGVAAGAPNPPSILDRQFGPWSLHEEVYAYTPTGLVCRPGAFTNFKLVRVPPSTATGNVRFRG